LSETYYKSSNIDNHPFYVLLFFLYFANTNFSKRLFLTPKIQHQNYPGGRIFGAGWPKNFA